MKITITRIDELHEALKSLLDKNIRFGLFGASAGAGLNANLMTIPGVTKIFHESIFAHSKEAIIDYLGFEPDNFVSMETAIEQAMMAYYRTYQADGKFTIGIGTTAAVATTTIHKNKHRVWVGVVTDDNIMVYHAQLVKGVGEETRSRDLLACDMLIGAAILTAANEQVIVKLPENVEFDEIIECNNLAMITLSKRPYFRADGQRLTRNQLMQEVAEGMGIYPGSFKIPHFGHFGIANEFKKKYRQQVLFSIEAHPPHKKDLTIQEILRRAKLLKGHNVVFTWDSPYYIDKAQLFPNTNIILGVDALISLLDSRWGISVEELQHIFCESGTTLIVSDRLVNGIFMTLEDLDLPAGFPCERLPGRFDISSTELLKKAIL